MSVPPLRAGFFEYRALGYLEIVETKEIMATMQQISTAENLAGAATSAKLLVVA